MGQSYTNPGGSGDRTTLIEITGSCLVATPPYAYSFINGSHGNQSWFANGQGAGTSLIFDFREPRVIDEATWYQDFSTSHGTWQWAGSNDGSTWTDIGSTFTLGGAPQVQTSLNGNTTAYRYYRLLCVGGSTTSANYIQEIEFSIDDATQAPNGYWIGALSSGDRTGLITATTTAFVHGSVDNWIDGAYALNTTDSWWFNGFESGREIKFDFGVPKIINGAKERTDTTDSQGTWQWQGSNDDSTWTDIGSSFTFAANINGYGVITFDMAPQLSGNTTAYRYYRMLQLSGTTNNANWHQELFFSEGASSSTTDGVGSVAGTGAASAAGSTILGAAGSAAGTAAASAVGSKVLGAAGSAAGTGTGTGVGSAGGSIGAAAAVALASAVGVEIAAATGAAVGVGAASAAGQAFRSAVGAAAGVGAASAPGLDAGHVRAMVGVAVAVASTTGEGFVALASGVGLSVGRGTATGVVDVDATEAVGDASATLSADAEGTYLSSAVGVAHAVSVVEASSDNSTVVALGIAAGTSSASGALSQIRSGAGTAAAIGGAQARATTMSAGVGAAVGIGSAAAPSVAAREAVGVSTGVLSVAGDALGIVSARGIASGSLTASGGGSRVLGLVGTAQASGEALSPSRAIFSGVGSSHGVGAAAGPTVGYFSAAGHASAAGAGDAPSHIIAVGRGRATGISLATSGGVHVGSDVPNERTIVVGAFPNTIVVDPCSIEARTLVVAAMPGDVIVPPYAALAA